MLIWVEGRYFLLHGAKFGQSPLGRIQSMQCRTVTSGS